MPFRRWLKESIKEAELLYLYNEAVRGDIRYRDNKGRCEDGGIEKCKGGV